MRRRRSSVGAHDGEMASCTKDKERHGVFRKYSIPLPWISVNINIAVFYCCVFWCVRSTGTGPGTGLSV